MLGTSVDDSLDLSCLFEEDCPTAMHALRDAVQLEIAKDPYKFKQLLRFEDSDLSSHIGALDISGDVSADGTGSLRGSTRQRQRRERAAHVFRCKTADLVTWQVEHVLLADGSAVSGSDLQQMMRLQDTNASWDCVEVTLCVGDALDQVHAIGAIERGAVLPLHGGALGKLFEDSEEEVAVQCRSCTGDALQRLCFCQQLRGARLIISHMRDAAFGVHRVHLQWTPVLAEGVDAAQAASPDPGASAAEKAELWQRRLIDLFLEHGVLGREGSMDNWQPNTDNPEFAYPNGEYYVLHWDAVLKKHEFFSGQQPDVLKNYRK
jgi:hypothetical protein